MVALVYCAQVHSSATYQDVVAACCGSATRNFCSLAIAFYSFGTCVTFLIIIGDQWDKCKIVSFTFLHSKYRQSILVYSSSAEPRLSVVDFVW